MKKLVIAGVGGVVVIAIGIALFITVANSAARREKQEALATALTVALDAKKTGAWSVAVKALEKPLANLGADQFANRDVADTLLSEAKAQVKKRADFAAKLREGQALFEQDKFVESHAAFQSAKEIFPDSPQKGAADEGIQKADTEKAKRELFAAKFAEGKVLLDRNEWKAAVAALDIAKKSWPTSPQASELETVMARALDAASKESRLQAEADRLKKESDERDRAARQAAQKERDRVLYEQAWPDRAAMQAEAIFEGEQQADLAVILKNFTHPSGTDPSIRSVKSEVSGLNVTVTIAFDFKGGFTGNVHTTTLGWTFNRGAPIGLKVVSDTAPVAIGHYEFGELEKWFSDKVYPDVMDRSK
jgi:hypothetical protein